MLEDLDVLDGWSVNELFLGGLVWNKCINVAALEWVYCIGLWDVLLDMFMDFLCCMLLCVIVIKSDLYCQAV